MPNNRFSHGRSTFTCSSCGRLTRLSGQGQDSECCFECWELAGYQNAISDGTPVADVISECNHLLKSIGRRGGDVERVKADCADIFGVEVEPTPVEVVARRGRSYEGSFAQKCDIASFAGGTIEQIAEAAGTTPGTIRTHFKFRTSKGKYLLEQDGTQVRLVKAS
jgi:hypothetical protein